MKKIIAGVIGFVMALGASAQVTAWDSSKPAQAVTFGVRAGMNVANAGGDAEDMKSKIGFFGGVAVDFNIVRSFSINSGLFFTQKGCKTDKFSYVDEDFGLSMTADARMTMNYLEIPVYASYRLNLDSDNALQIFFGPYFDYGVYGKLTATVKADNQKASESINVYDKDEMGGESLDRFQMGLGLGAAYSYRKFSLGLSYQWGLTEIASDAGAHWNNFNISLGYNF